MQGADAYSSSDLNSLALRPKAIEVPRATASLVALP